MGIIDLGEKISRYRQNQNMTQEELAARMSVTPQAVSRWERNQSLPDITMFADVCRILNISADYLLNIESGQMSEDYDSLGLQHIMKMLRSCNEPVSLQFGEGLVKIFMKDDSWKALVDGQRRRLAAEGMLLPVIRVMDQLELEETEVRIVSYHKILYKEKVKEISEDTCRGIIEKLGDIVWENYAFILNAQIVKVLTDNLKIAYPAQIEGIIPEIISYSLLLDVLKNFISRGNSKRNLLRVIEFIERELRTQPQLTAKELAEGAETWLISTAYERDRHADASFG